MSKVRFKVIILFYLLCQISQLAIGQINTDVNGNWDYTIPTNDLTEAGLDFTGTYSSNTNQVTIDIFQPNFFTNLFSNYPWQVNVRRADIDWNSSLKIYVRRTGDGAPFSTFFGPGSINGGGSYQLLSTSNQFFFNGVKSRFDIPIQYEIRDVSLLLPAKSYETTIIYTVTDL